METVNTATLLSQILPLELVIPAWQMAFFIVLISIFMLVQRIKLCLMTTFLFTFYWGFFLYFGDVIASFGRLPYVLCDYPSWQKGECDVSALYLASGMIYILLTLIAFYREGSRHLAQEKAEVAIAALLRTWTKS